MEPGFEVVEQHANVELEGIMMMLVVVVVAAAMKRKRARRRCCCVWEVGAPGPVYVCMRG